MHNRWLNPGEGKKVHLLNELASVGVCCKTGVADGSLVRQKYPLWVASKERNGCGARLEIAWGLECNPSCPLEYDWGHLPGPNWKVPEKLAG